MTCIVGLVHGDTVYMGADSAGVSGLDLRLRKDSKVFLRGEFVMGFTTSFRMGQLLQHKFVPPQILDGVDPYDYMPAFIDSVFEVRRVRR